MIRMLQKWLKRSLPNNLLTNVVSVDDHGSTARRPSPTFHPDLQFYDTQLLEKMDKEENGEIDDDILIAHGILFISRNYTDCRGQYIYGERGSFLAGLRECFNANALIKFYLPC